MKNGDKEVVIEGLKNIGKVVAVSGLAIGVVDLIDGADIVEAEEIDTINDDLAGVLQLVDEETHAQTGHTGGREIWGGGSDYR